MKCPECGIDLPQPSMFVGDGEFTSLVVYCKNGHPASLVSVDGAWSVLSFQTTDADTQSVRT